MSADIATWAHFPYGQNHSQLRSTRGKGNTETWLVHSVENAATHTAENAGDAEENQCRPMLPEGRVDGDAGNGP